MIKGAQKRMRVVKTTDSPIFEEAYFVLRRESNGGDMVEEANRIIDNSGARDGSGRMRLSVTLISVLCFLFGGGVGSFAVGLAVLLV